MHYQLGHQQIGGLQKTLINKNDEILDAHRTIMRLPTSEVPPNGKHSRGALQVSIVKNSHDIVGLTKKQDEFTTAFYDL